MANSPRIRHLVLLSPLSMSLLVVAQIALLIGCTEDNFRPADPGRSDVSRDFSMPECDGTCPSAQSKVADSATYCGYRCIVDVDSSMDVEVTCTPCEPDEMRVRRDDNFCGYICQRSRDDDDAGQIDVDQDLPPVETCSNLVDDDYDGYIDCADPDCCEDARCVGSASCPSAVYRYVRLQGGSDDDLTEPYPGPDIDAIHLTKNGTDTEIGLAADPTATYNSAPQNGSEVSGLVGLVGDDAECDLNDPTSFYSVGGTDSSVVGMFDGETIIENGDEISVHEVGELECGEGFGDESWIMQVSDAEDGTWINIGTGTGSKVFPILGL